MKIRNLFDLTDRIAVVTGSTKGIGRAIAEAFAHHGAKVVISERDSQTDGILLASGRASERKQRFDARQVLAVAAAFSALQPIAAMSPP